MNMRPRTEMSLDEDIDSVFQFGNEMNDSPVDDTNDDAGNTSDANAAGGDKEAPVVDDSADLKEGLPDPLTEKPLRNEKGELVDKDGNVIAATRAEKREFFAQNRMRHALDKIDAENKTLKQQLQGLQQLQQLPTRLGLQTEQVVEAMQFRAQLESDPINAVREIVARVLQSGYTMDQLFGEGAPAAINAKIISDQLDTRLKPITDRFAASEREQRITEAAEKDLNDFVDTHPYADIHGEQIARMVQQYDLTPEKAYYELRVAVLEKGLDFSKPLGPQVEAGRSTQTRQPAPVQQRSTPGGPRSVAPNGTDSVATRQQTFAPDTPFKDIVAAAFRATSNNVQ